MYVSNGSVNHCLLLSSTVRHDSMRRQGVDILAPGGKKYPNGSDMQGFFNELIWGRRQFDQSNPNVQT